MTMRETTQIGYKTQVLTLRLKVNQACIQMILAHWLTNIITEEKVMSKPLIKVDP